VINLSEYGNLFSSGLTDPRKRIFEDAFLPCRNLLFLTIGAAYAYQNDANAVAIGLLHEKDSLFPDQTKMFLRETEMLLSRSLARETKILAPLMSFTKSDVVHVARERGISGTYSCHAGTAAPCGICVACREYIGLEV
jgi:7-cyano-7-deazaguanine synthase